MPGNRKEALLILMKGADAGVTECMGENTVEICGFSPCVVLAPPRWTSGQCAMGSPPALLMPGQPWEREADGKWSFGL